MPWRGVDDEDGLWSFRVYGEKDAATVLVLLPAMGVPARYYTPLLRNWLAEGVAVIQADFTASQVRPDAARVGKGGFAALVECCVPVILGEARDNFPLASAVIVGHSLGGQLGLIAAGRFAPEMALVLAASGSVDHRCFRGFRRWAILPSLQAMLVTARVLGHWPGDRLGFGGRQPTAMMRDWGYTVRTGRYHSLTGSFDYESALQEYRGTLLAINVEHDALAPEAALEALLAKIPNARVTRYTYAASRGAAKPGAHLTWIKDQPGLSRIISDWARCS